ncbi:hypothetical protein ERJ75_000571200 [Trypanosoma vivax]|nr:hypothetical protein ERJ75_000571200 [Trypanosoma vivax]
MRVEQQEECAQLGWRRCRETRKACDGRKADGAVEHAIARWHRRCGKRTGNLRGIGDTGTAGHGHCACETFDRRVDRGGASARRRERRTKRLDKRLGGSLVISRERRRATGPVRFAPVLRQRRTWQTRDH